MRIPLTRYGRREIILATAVLGALTAVGALLFWPAALLPAAVWLYVLTFFRDPQRRPEADDGLLAPADGKVVDITSVGPDGPVGRPGVRIGIFMSIFDCHVNRSPCEAEVVHIEHRAGGFLDARRPEAAERNESATIALAHERGGQRYTVMVRQVAGLIARRIVTDLHEGQRIGRGQRIGMVKFGSRVELIVPTELVGRVCVKVGQSVRAGRTVLVWPAEEPARAPQPALQEKAR